MKILINTSVIRFGGALQVAQSFIHECRAFPDHEYFVLVGAGLEKLLQQEHFPANFHFFSVPFGPVTPGKIRHRARILSRIEKQIRPDVVITTSGPAYWRSEAPHFMGYNLPVYIYPESPYFRLVSLKKKFTWFLKKQVHLYYFNRDGEAFFVQTEDVRMRLLKYLKKKNIRVISNTHNAHYLTNKDNRPKLPERNEGEIRLLTISSYYRHKNLEIIPEVLQELNKLGYNQVRFIVTLPEQKHHAITGGVPLENFITTGPLKPDECPGVYRECDFMFLPTLLECFSASYPEAMVMQKPILTSDLGFARNICGEAALYFNPMDPKDIANKVVELILNEELRRQLVSNGLSRLSQFDDAAARAKKILDAAGDLAGEVTKPGNK